MGSVHWCGPLATRGAPTSTLINHSGNIYRRSAKSIGCDYFGKTTFSCRGIDCLQLTYFQRINVNAADELISALGAGADGRRGSALSVPAASARPGRWRSSPWRCPCRGSVVVCSIGGTVRVMTCVSMSASSICRTRTSRSQISGCPEVPPPSCPVRYIASPVDSSGWCHLTPFRRWKT